MPQDKREQALSTFKHGQCLILISTAGLLGRGISIQGLTRLILWVLPRNLALYKIAIGRLGHLGDHGVAKVFFNMIDTLARNPEFVDFLM